MSVTEESGSGVMSVTTTETSIPNIKPGMSSYIPLLLKNINHKISIVAPATTPLQAAR